MEEREEYPWQCLIVGRSMLRPQENSKSLPPGYCQYVTLDLIEVGIVASTGE